jgi:hypothetical protein
MANKKFLLELSGFMMVFAGLVLTGCPIEEKSSEPAVWTPPPQLPQLTGTVSVIGTLEEGNTLTVDTSGLNGTGTISYQWRRDYTNIDGATASTYTVKDIDIGSTIKVSVRRDGYTSYVEGSIAPILRGIVTITGTPKKNMRLTANTSELGGSGGIISYQWLRNSVEIGGATGSTYTVKDLDLGTTLKVRVRRSGYSGFIEAEIAAPALKTYTIRLKYAADAGEKEAVIFEGENGDTLESTPSSPINVSTTSTTVSVKSYYSRFKMRVNFMAISLKYYYKNGGGDEELFDFKEGTTTYTLTNKRDGYWGFCWDLIAEEG